MSPAELTGVLGALVSVISAIVIPIYLRRQQSRSEAGAASEVSWKAINQAIAKERDLAQERLTAQATQHTAEIDAMRSQHRAEISELRNAQPWPAAEMRTGLDREASDATRLADCQAKLADCQKKVGELYEELYRQRPPR